MKQYFIGLVLGFFVGYLLPEFPTESTDEIKVEVVSVQKNLVPRQISIHGRFNDAIRYSVDITVLVPSEEYEYTRGQWVCVRDLTMNVYNAGMLFTNMDYEKFKNHMNNYIKFKLDGGDLELLEIKWEKEKIRKKEKVI